MNRKLSLSIFCILLLAACSFAQAEEAFPIKAGDGTEIFSPIDTATIEVAYGDKAVKIPRGMVHVPAGRFRFGPNEQRELPAFHIGRFEVTNREYQEFLLDARQRNSPRYWKNQVYPEGKANQPVLYVSLDDADAYCAWVSRKTGWKVIVPSAEQWEKAARGPYGNLYPWGNDRGSRYQSGKLTTHFNYNAVCAAHMLEVEAKTLTKFVGKSNRAGEECLVEAITSGNGQTFRVTMDGGVNAWIDHSTNTGFVNTQIYRDLVDNGGFTTAVGSFPTGVSHFGCHDMAGNAYEWTSSLITATNGAEKGQKVNEVRGGSWYSTGRSGTSLSTGEGRNRRGGYNSVGFRIAMEP